MFLHEEFAPHNLIALVTWVQFVYKDKALEINQVGCMFTLGKKLYMKWSSSQGKWYNILVIRGWSEFLSMFRRKSEKQIEFLWIREWCQIDLISVGQQLSETYLHSKETPCLHTLKKAVAFLELLSHLPSALTKPIGVLQQLQLDFPCSARPEEVFIPLSFAILSRNKC